MMADVIDYNKPIVVFDEISEETWRARYAGPHPTMLGWHSIIASGSERDVQPDGYVIGPQATLKVRNRD
jgi:hypothetical protein